MENALVDIEESGPEWLEWCAALYESYAADREWNNGETYLSRATHGDYTIQQYGDALASLGSYCGAAQAVAESIEYQVYQERQNKIEFDLAWGCWQEQIYDPDR